MMKRMQEMVFVLIAGIIILLVIIGFYLYFRISSIQGPVTSIADFISRIVGPM